MNRKLILSIAFSVLLSATMACSLTGMLGRSAEEVEDTPTPEVIVVTATTDMEKITEEPAMETEEPADMTAMATLKQDLNIRTGPSVDYPVMTALPGGTSLEIIGKNSAGTWWKVKLPNGTDEGWASASYTDSVNTDSVPVVDAPPPPQTNSTPEIMPTSATPGAGSVAPADSDLSKDINIKNGSFTVNGAISYPDGDSVDKVYVHVNGFDGATTSGEVIYSLTCSSTGSPPSITNIGGSVTNGVVGCNSSWTVFYTNVSYSTTITIQQESTAYAEWTLFASAVGN